MFCSKKKCGYPPFASNNIRIDFVVHVWNERRCECPIYRRALCLLGQPHEQTKPRDDCLRVHSRGRYFVLFLALFTGGGGCRTYSWSFVRIPTETWLGRLTQPRAYLLKTCVFHCCISIEEYLSRVFRVHNMFSLLEVPRDTSKVNMITISCPWRGGREVVVLLRSVCIKSTPPVNVGSPRCIFEERVCLEGMVGLALHVCPWGEYVRILSPKNEAHVRNQITVRSSFFLRESVGRRGWGSMVWCGSITTHPFLRWAYLPVCVGGEGRARGCGRRAPNLYRLSSTVMFLEFSTRLICVTARHSVPTAGGGTCIVCDIYETNQVFLHK